ncbi:MAG: hypothetical protein J1D86_06405 [Alistipes sp.]|nr:hypothetical protein [Alistipes sp.]
MTTEELKNKVEDIIEKTFEELEMIYLYCCDNRSVNTEGGVVFPKYSKEKIRVSEQELRCVFIQNLCKAGLHYSVETPTIKRYSFADKTSPKVYERDSNSGESARIDLTIHDKDAKRLCIVEFKAHGGAGEHNCKKDFLKLYAEPDVDLRYFIQIFESFNKKTFNSVKEKLKNSSKYIIENVSQNAEANIFDKVQCRFHSFKFGKNEREYNNRNIYEKLLNCVEAAEAQ